MGCSKGWSNVIKTVCALALSLAPLGAVNAATDASDVVVDVVDAKGGAPVPLACVILQGERGAIGYTDADGHARFESVTTGSYRAAVAKRGYILARSSLFEVVVHHSTTVQVKLAKMGGLQQIGSVRVTTSPARASREIGQSDPLRYLNGSLQDALGELPGLTSSGGGFGIDGNDPSQTGTSIDGVPLPGAGGALANRGINADLFGGASANSGAANGALGGTINFHSLQPTLFPQQQTTLQYGSDDASSALVVARGSVHNLGYVLEHAVRGRTSPLTGLNFTDESGLTYVHQGDRSAQGDLAKLRWSPSLAQTLTLTGSATNDRSASVCSMQTALLPCGFGPGIGSRTRSTFATLAESATIGATSIFIGGSVNGSRTDDNRTRRYFAGTSTPSANDLRSLGRALTLSVQLPGGGRHDLSLSATTSGIAFSGTATNAYGSFPFGARSAYRGANLIDHVRPNEHVTATLRLGVAGGDGGASLVRGVDLRWQPKRDLVYDIAATAGDTGSSLAVSSSAFPDPRSLTFDCVDGVAIGMLPATNATRQGSSSLRASVERSGKRARVAVTAWTQRLHNSPVFGALDAGAVGVPAGYLAAVDALAGSPYVCGSSAPLGLAFTAFAPADQIARGLTVAGTLQIGSALLAGYASVQSRFVSAATPQTTVLTPPGAQIPDVPLHRAGLVGTVKLGRSVDALANVSYTAANNPNRLPAYTIVNAGVAMPLREGSLALVGTNLTNRFSAPFVRYSDVRGLPRVGAAPLALSATPLAPRGIALTYTLRVGRLGASRSGAGTVDAAAAAENGGGVTVMIRGDPLPSTAPPDALRIDPDNEHCTPVAARLAQSVLDAIGTIRDAAERAKTNGRYPASLHGIPTTTAGVTLQYRAYADGARYAITAVGTMQQSAASLNCGRFAFAQSDDLTKRGLYGPPTGEKHGFFIAYSPLVGLYFLPPSDIINTTKKEVRTEPVPSVPPAAPLMERSECPSSDKPVADAMIAAVRAAREAVRAGTPLPLSDVVGVVAHGNAPFWLALKPRDVLATSSILACLHVATVRRTDLDAAGIADTRRGGLGFSDRFGFYILTREPPSGGAGQTQPGGKAPPGFAVSLNPPRFACATSALALPRRDRSSASLRRYGVSARRHRLREDTLGNM